MEQLYQLYKLYQLQGAIQAMQLLLVVDRTNRSPLGQRQRCLLAISTRRRLVFYPVMGPTTLQLNRRGFPSRLISCSCHHHHRNHNSSQRSPNKKTSSSQRHHIHFIRNTSWYIGRTSYTSSHATIYSSISQTNRLSCRLTIRTAHRLTNNRSIQHKHLHAQFLIINAKILNPSRYYKGHQIRLKSIAILTKQV